MKGERFGFVLLLVIGFLLATVNVVLASNSTFSCTRAPNYSCGQEHSNVLYMTTSTMLATDAIL